MEGFARLFVAMMFVAIFIQMVKRGPAGAGEWFKAKFLGQPTVHKRVVTR